MSPYTVINSEMENSKIHIEGRYSFFTWSIFLSLISDQNDQTTRAEPRIAQLLKAQICNLTFAGSSRTAGGVFIWYRPLASLSLEIAIMGSNHRGKKMEVSTSEQGLKSLNGF